MANFDLTDAAALIKRLYEPGKVGDVVAANNSALNLLPKFTSLAGNEWITPVQSGYVQNSSGTGSVSFSTTYATSSAVVDAFKVTPYRLLNRATIDHLSMVASRNDQGAFLRTSKVQIDGALKGRAAQTETQLFRSGWGDVGVIAGGGVSGATFTLATITDAVNFEKGQKLVFSASQASNVLRSATPIVVAGVNRVTGVVTCDTALATPGAVAGDWVFIYGDRDNSATPTKLVLTGFGGWIPSTAPTTGDSFFSVDRSSDPTRLGGLRLDATGANVVELVNTACGLVDQEGGSIDHLFMGSQQYAQFVNALGSKVQYQALNLKGSDEMTIGVSAIKIMSNFGAVNIVPARKCPAASMFGLKLDTWSLGSMGALIDLFRDDVDMLRVQGDDVYEVRVGGYGTLRCNEPGHNIQIYNVGS